jgi:D-alanyl-D-alanine carboxypeptidase/D-alanyl-D-alanine-endopeptidase (penicillin-binding protein 4)
LYTAALAFDRLGPEYAFSTDLLRDGPIDSAGVVRGNLVLRGDGDPSLSPRFVSGGYVASMALLSQFARNAGVRRVTGDLIADASAFESRRIPDGWLSRYAGAAYAAPFSALSLNENVIVVSVAPKKSGQAAVVSLEPATRGITVSSTARTVAGRSARLSIRRLSDDRVMVTGSIGALAGTRRYQLVVGDPALYTAGALRAALEEKGIVIEGSIRLGTAPPTATAVASLVSPPLNRMVSTMNRESINHLAEMLWRNAARGRDRVALGSAENANLSLQEFLQTKVGTPRGVVTATDGSGLSVLDRVTARSLIQLLSYAHRAPWMTSFRSSLPVAGVSELLRSRMRATPAQGNLHAKTGTTNDVIALSGYVTATNGEMLAFALLYNGRERWHARESIDAIGATLAGFWRD